MVGSTNFHDFFETVGARAKGAARIVTAETTKAVETDLLSDPISQSAAAAVSQL